MIWSPKGKRIVAPSMAECRASLGLSLGFGGGPVAAFTPGSIAGLALDLNADVGVTGSPVDSWANQGSAGGTFTGATTARPSVNATGINGRNALVFDGSNDVLNSTKTIADVFGSATAFTLFALVDFTSASADSDYHQAGVLVDSQAYLNVFTFGGTTPRVSVVQYDASYKQVDRTISAGSAHVYTAHFNGSTLSLQVDSGTTATVSVGAPGSLTGSLKIGANYNAGDFAAFKIRRLLGYNAALTAPQVTQVQAFLATF